MSKKPPTIEQFYHWDYINWVVGFFYAVWLTLISLYVFGWEFYIGLVFLVFGLVVSIGWWKYSKTIKKLNRNQKRNVLKLILFLNLILFIGSFIIRDNQKRVEIFNSLKISLQTTNNPFKPTIVFENDGRVPIPWHKTVYLINDNVINANGEIKNNIEAGGAAFSVMDSTINSTNEAGPQLGGSGVILGGGGSFIYEKSINEKRKDAELTIVFFYKTDSIFPIIYRKSKRFIYILEGDVYKWYEEPVDEIFVAERIKRIEYINYLSKKQTEINQDKNTEWKNEKLKKLKQEEIKEREKDFKWRSENVHW